MKYMQEYTSKNTSVNTHKLPRVFRDIDLKKLKGKTIFDYGAGKYETVRLVTDFLALYDIDYIPFDLYNLSDGDNFYAWEKRHDADLYICSNVLNVIKENDIVQDIITEINKLCNNSPLKGYIFKIYEGDKSHIGKNTKKDCWQKNETKDYYLKYFTWDKDNGGPAIYKGYIINIIGKSVLSKRR